VLITALKPTKNKRRLNLFIDNKFAFSFDPQLVFTHKLTVNKKLTTKQFQNLLHDACFSKLYDKTLNFLSYRPRSIQETEFYLKKQIKKLTQSNTLNTQKLIDQILNKLKLKKFLNDQTFVKWWVDQRVTHRPKGNFALKAELFQKGINKDIINQHLLSAEQEKKLAKQVLQKKFSRFKPLSSQKFKLKASQFLKSRGFSSSAIYSLIDEFISE